MERDVKRLGVVLAKREVGEGNVLLSLFSPSLSLVEVKEFGARKGKKALRVPLYSEGNFSLYRKGENSYILKDVDFITIRHEIMSSYERMIFSSLMAEMTLKGKDYSENIYNLISSSLDRMTETYDEKRVLIYFISHYLDFFGSLGDFTTCPVCHRKYRDDEVLGFNESFRVASCSSCSDREGMILPPSARAFLARTLELDMDDALSLGISEMMRDRILSYLLRTLSLVWPSKLSLFEGQLMKDWI